MFGSVESADVIFTVPAAWDAAGCGMMRDAALKAGMVMNSGGNDKNWRDRLRIITYAHRSFILFFLIDGFVSMVASRKRRRFTLPFYLLYIDFESLNLSSSATPEEVPSIRPSTSSSEI
jgi:hypothetical protein